MFSHSIDHAILHFIIDSFLGFRAAINGNREILTESAFFSFVGLCENLEELFLIKFVLSLVLLVVIYKYPLNYAHVLNNANNLAHDISHELIHMVFGFSLLLYYEYSVVNSCIITMTFSLCHIVWQTNDLKKYRIVFGVMVVLHLSYYGVFGKAFYFDIVEMIYQ